MDYIIPRKKLFDAIYSHIDSELKKDNLDWRYFDDSSDDGYNNDIIEFFGDRWDTESEPLYFQYIKKEYYDINDEDKIELVKKWYDKAPLLDFFGYENPFWEHLNDTFGDLWKPVIKKWFEDHFPEFPVKTYVMR